MKINDITGIIIDAAIEVHNYLGPGLLESAYQQCLHSEMCHRGLNVVGQMPLPVVYKDIKIETGYRVDFMVEDHVIVELKACEQNASLHKAQLFTYLKLSEKQFGLLINFNAKLLKNGITRIINPYFYDFGNTREVIFVDPENAENVD